MGHADLERAARQLKFRDPAARGGPGSVAAPGPWARSAATSWSCTCAAATSRPSRKFGLRAILPAVARRDHGAGLPGVHHRHARGGRSRRARRAGRGRRRPTATWSACPARDSRWPTRRPPAARSRSSTRSRRPSTSRARPATRWCSSPPASRPPRSPRRPSRCGDLPPNFSILSAHKYVPPAMEIVAALPDTKIEGFLAAGHAAVVTGLEAVRADGAPLRRADRGRGLRAARHPRRPPPARRAGPRRQPAVVNMYPRCVSRDGQPQRAGAAVEGVQAGRRVTGAASRGCPTATSNCGTSSRTSMRAGASPWATRGRPRTRRPRPRASAATS